MYYLLLAGLEERTAFIEAMKAAGIGTVFHYIPLHSSPAGERFARTVGPMPHTDAASARLVRLPFWVGLEDELDQVTATATIILSRSR
jgi:dTDP-4-amino-4,6-dideoxygalactose transaminase